MRRQLLASAAVAALFAVFGGAGFALAQDAGGGASGTPAGNPPATSQAPAGQTAAPATGEKLPEVQVIQQKPKAKPKPVKQAKRRPKAPPPVAAAPPPTAPQEAATENVEADT